MLEEMINWFPNNYYQVYEDCLRSGSKRGDINFISYCLERYSPWQCGEHFYRALINNAIQVPCMETAKIIYKRAIRDCQCIKNKIDSELLQQLDI